MHSTYRNTVCRSVFIFTILAFRYFDVTFPVILQIGLQFLFSLVLRFMLYNVVVLARIDSMSSGYFHETWFVHSARVLPPVSRSLALSQMWTTCREPIASISWNTRRTRRLKRPKSWNVPGTSGKRRSLRRRWSECSMDAWTHFPPLLICFRFASIYLQKFGVRVRSTPALRGSVWISVSHTIVMSCITKIHGNFRRCDVDSDV